MMPRQRLRRLTWLALTVMLGLALAPTVSRALSWSAAGHAPAALAAVAATEHADCDNANTAVPTPAMLPAPESAEASAQRSEPAHHGHHGGGGNAEPHDHLNHCPLCGVAATAWTVAPPAPAWDALPHNAAQQALPACDAAPCGFGAWSAHQPRGPPGQA
jgi:hypothetical protein